MWYTDAQEMTEDGTGNITKSSLLLGIKDVLIKANTMASFFILTETYIFHWHKSNEINTAM